MHVTHYVIRDFRGKHGSNFEPLYLENDKAFVKIIEQNLLREMLWTIWTSWGFFSNGLFRELWVRSLQHYCSMYLENDKEFLNTSWTKMFKISRPLSPQIKGQKGSKVFKYIFSTINILWQVIEAELFYS